MKGRDSTVGFDKSSPAMCIRPSKAEPVRVRAKLTVNWMVRRLSLPNMMIEIRADRTNIQANEQMKIVVSAFEFINEAIEGTKLPKEEATVVKAVRVKIW